MKTILMTGFDPFGGEQTNPSWEAVKALHDKTIVDTHRIQVLQLPCEFDRSLALLTAQIQALQASIVICVGQAGGRPDISIERVAINLNDARIPDNAGQQPVDTPVVAAGDAAYFSSLPVKTIMQTLRQRGIPASLSHTAGTYVCNHVFYGLMHYASQHPELQRAGFVHIPYLPEQAAAHPGSASMSLDMVRQALLILAEVTITAEKDICISGGITH
jgi:pyroglutamyl-peptidase